MFLCPDDWKLLGRKTGHATLADLRAAGLVTLGQTSFVPGTLSWRPQLRFRSKPLRQCPFLVNDLDVRGRLRGLCSLHPDFKPLVCALSPLTRTVEGTVGLFQETWDVVAPVEGCPGMGRGVAKPLMPPDFLRTRLDSEAQWVTILLGNLERLEFPETAWEYYQSFDSPC